MSEQKKGGDFLSRWSERKRAVAEENAAEAEAAFAQAEAAERRETELEANRAAAEAVDLETLTDKSDFTVFMKPGVPLALRQTALRKLWRSNPVYAVLDGLNDYDTDFSWPKPGSEVVRTLWKLGRGLLTDEDRAASAERAAANPAGASTKPDRSAEPAEMESAEAESDNAAAETPAVSAAARSPDPAEPGEDEADDTAEHPKVGLSRRLDLAAFAKPDEDGEA